jgi:hypothetical protein
MFAGVHVPHPLSPGGDDLQPTEASAHRIDARERPMLPNPESLKRIHEESGVIARKISSETSSLAQNAVRTHSTIGDKNFVQNYYKNSRLHFIGTWRNRYQSLVGALARNKRPNNKLENPDIKATSIPTIIHIDMWLLGSAENWMASLWQYATLIVLEAQQKSHQQTTQQDLLE